MADFVGNFVVCSDDMRARSAVRVHSHDMADEPTERVICRTSAGSADKGDIRQV